MNKICTIKAGKLKNLLYKMTNKNKQCKKNLKWLEIFILLWYYIICVAVKYTVHGGRKI